MDSKRQRLCREYQPAVSGRQTAMLMSLLAPAFSEDTPFPAQMQAWKLSIEQYRSETGKVFDGSMMIATITQHCPPSLRTTVRQASAASGDDWNKMEKQ